MTNFVIDNIVWLVAGVTALFVVVELAFLRNHRKKMRQEMAARYDDFCACLAALKANDFAKVDEFAQRYAKDDVFLSQLMTAKLLHERLQREAVPVELEGNAPWKGRKVQPAGRVVAPSEPVSPFTAGS